MSSVYQCFEEGRGVEKEEIILACFITHHFWSHTDPNS